MWNIVRHREQILVWVCRDLISVVHWSFFLSLSYCTYVFIWHYHPLLLVFTISCILILFVWSFADSACVIVSAGAEMGTMTYHLHLYSVKIKSLYQYFFRWILISPVVFGCESRGGEGARKEGNMNNETRSGPLLIWYASFSGLLALLPNMRLLPIGDRELPSPVPAIRSFKYVPFILLCSTQLLTCKWGHTVPAKSCIHEILRSVYRTSYSISSPLNTPRTDEVGTIIIEPISLSVSLPLTIDICGIIDWFRKYS